MWKVNSHPHGYGCLSPTGSLTGDFDDLKNLMSQSGNTLKVKYSFPSNGDYSQQSIALIAIIFVSAITALLIPFAECVPRPSFFQIFDFFKWLFHLYVTNIQPCHTSLPVYPPKMIPGHNFGILASSTRIGGYSYIWSKHEMDVSIVCIDSNCPVIPLPSPCGGYKNGRESNLKC